MDYIPRNWAAFAVWFENFVNQLPALAAKYSVSSDKVTQLQKDNVWTQYWANAQALAKQQKKQLTDYVDGVRKGKLGTPALTDPVWDLGAPPAGVPNGINDRIREVANSIKAQKSVYNTADGELLGIVTAEETNLNENDLQPSLKFDSESNYNLEAEFRLFGADALQIETRLKGGDWTITATLTSSPGVFHVVPTNAGEAQTVEVRAIFIKKNKPVGQYSPIYSEVIKP